MPSVLVITRLPVPEVATATNKPFPKVTSRHSSFDAAFLIVQFIPSELVITLLVPVDETATNLPLP